MSPQPPPSTPQPPVQPATTDQVLDQHRDALKERFPMPSADALQRRRGGRAAKIVLPLLLITASGVFIADPAWQVHDYRSAVGERRGIRLPDGSHLLLDAGTHLQVRRHIRSRQVVLVQGRARFQVQHSTSAPVRGRGRGGACAQLRHGVRR